MRRGMEQELMMWILFAAMVLLVLYAMWQVLT